MIKIRDFKIKIIHLLTLVKTRRGFSDPLLLHTLISVMYVVLYKILVYRMFSSICTLYCIPSFALNNIIFIFFQYSFGQNTKTLTLFNKTHKLIQCVLLSWEEKKEARSKTDKGIQDIGHQQSQNFTIQST